MPTVSLTFGAFSLIASRGHRGGRHRRGPREGDEGHEEDEDRDEEEVNAFDTNYPAFQNTHEHHKTMIVYH